MPEAATYTRTHKNLTSHYARQVEGGFVKISSHQLALWWFLLDRKAISRRELHIIFAAQEMATRRRIARQSAAKRGAGRHKPRNTAQTAPEAAYSVEEVQALVGEGAALDPLSELSRAIKRLGRLGVVKIKSETIEFAQSIEQINGLDDETIGAFFEHQRQFPGVAHCVCVPRRLLRAMAGGFTKSKMAVLIALLLRSMVWHQDGQAFRCDGRTKAASIAAAFGVGIRSVRQARQELRELGIITPVSNKQWALNQWGSQDIINVQWTPGMSTPEQAPEASSDDQAANDNAVETLPGRGANLHPSTPNSRGKTAPPYKPFSSSLREESKNHTPDHRPGNGFFASKGRKAAKAKTPPNIGYGITRGHLLDDDAMLELHTQAVSQRLIPGGRDCMIEFYAMANHALCHAKNVPAMFVWQFKKWHTGFLTHADYEAGKARVIRHEWRGDADKLERSSSFEPWDQTKKPKKKQLSRDAVLVQQLQAQAKWDESMLTTFNIQLKNKHGWTDQRWDDAEREIHNQWDYSGE